MIKSFKKVAGNTEFVATVVLTVCVLVGVFLFKSVGGWIPKSEIRSENVE